MHYLYEIFHFCRRKSLKMEKIHFLYEMFHLQATQSVLQ